MKSNRSRNSTLPKCHARFFVLGDPSFISASANRAASSRVFMPISFVTMTANPTVQRTASPLADLDRWGHQPSATRMPAGHSAALHSQGVAIHSKAALSTVVSLGHAIPRTPKTRRASHLVAHQGMATTSRPPGRLRICSLWSCHPPTIWSRRDARTAVVPSFGFITRAPYPERSASQARARSCTACPCLDPNRCLHHRSPPHQDRPGASTHQLHSPGA